MTFTPRTLVRAAWPWILSALVATIILGPALTAGYPLIRDMVFVPDLTWNTTTWGTGTALPRAVPSDGYIATLDNIIPSTYLPALILLTTLTTYGSGTYRLSQHFGASHPAASAATVIALWNPYVASRLAIGHWALLVGIAALPWLITSRRVTAKTLASVAAAFTPTSGLLAATWLIASTRRRTLATNLTLALATNAPWIFAGLAHAHHATTTPHSSHLFTPNSSTPLPDGPLNAALSSLLGAGLWNRAASPPDLATWPAFLPATTITTFGLIALLAQLRKISPNEPPPDDSLLNEPKPDDAKPNDATRNESHKTTNPATTHRTTCYWALAWLTFTLTTCTPAAGQLLDWTTTTIPGSGILRDSQKFTAPFTLCIAALAPITITKLTHTLPTHLAHTAMLAAAALPVITSPHLASGLNHQLAPTHYPQHWHKIAQHLQTHPTPPVTAILPQNLYLHTTWTGPNPHLDPLPRFLPGHTIATDTLTIDGHTASSEDHAAQHLTQTLNTGGNLAQLGITHIAHHGPLNTHNHTAIRNAKIVVSGDDLTLYQLPNPTPSLAEPLRPLTGWRVGLVSVGWALHALTLTAGLAALAITACRRRPQPANKT